MALAITGLLVSVATIAASAFSLGYAIGARKAKGGTQC